MAAVLTTTKRQHELILMIMLRAQREELCGHEEYEAVTLAMDWAAMVNNGNPEPHLARLLDSSLFDFTHDICGVARHMDRATGKLGGCFVPRCTR